MKPMTPPVEFSVFRPSLNKLRKDLFNLRRPVAGALMLLVFLSLFSSPVMAQTVGNVGFFGDIGNKAKAFFCAFLDSPIVPVVLGIALAIVLLMMVFGDENSGSSKTLKGILIGVCVMFIPKIIDLLGWVDFSATCLTNFKGF